MDSSSSLPDPGLFPLPELAVARHPSVILAPRQLKRWIGELPLANPPRSIEMLHQQLHVLVHDPQPGPRLITLLGLYTAPVGQLLAIVTGRMQVDADDALPMDPLERRLVDVLETLGDGYLRVFNEALLVGRPPAPGDLYTATWALDQALAIRQLRYRPLARLAWQRLLKLFLCAERHGLGDQPAAPDRRQEDEPDTIRGLFLRALVIGMADPHGHRPSELRAWRDWLAGRTGALELAPQPRGEHTIPVDISGTSVPPADAARDAEGAEIRHLLLDGLLPRAAGPMPALRAALLARIDGRRTPDARRSPRRSSARPYRIVLGLRNVFERLNALAGAPPAQHPPAAWDARQLDQSKRGAAFLVENTVKPPVSIGMPVLAEVAGQDGSGAPLGFAALIRRVIGVDERDFQIGVEKLQGRIIPVTIATVTGGRSYAAPHGVLLDPGPPDELTLLAPRAWYRPDDRIAVEGPATRYRLRMAGLQAIAHDVARISVEPDGD